VKKLDLSRYKFSDAEFLAADDKAKTLRDWERFLRLGMKFESFSNRLYKHLTLHCSFIAHYDRHGFYHTYFVKPAMARKFLSQFDGSNGGGAIELGMTYWLTDARYADINRAMCDVAEVYAPMFYPELESQERERDLALAKQLVAKWEGTAGQPEQLELL